MKKFFQLSLSVIFSMGTLYSQNKPVALVGGTILDVSNYGNESNDLKNSLIVLLNGKIIYAGSYKKGKVPPQAEIVDVSGKFILPGLIDGFATLNSQSYANAYLYMGVTSVAVTFDGDPVRGDNYLKANPSPRLERMFWLDQLFEPSDTSRMTETEQDVQMVSKQIDKLDSFKKAGLSIAFLHHRFPAAMNDKMVSRSKSFNMATIGEMQYAPYKSAVKAGVNALVHTLRYSLEAYPDSLRDVFIHYPHKQGKYIHWYSDTLARKKDTALWNWANYLAQSRTALIPTLAMTYAFLQYHDNLWNEPVAAILDSSEIHLPMNKQTGKWTDDSTWWKDGACDHAMAGIYIRAGCHFLTGSGTDAFGSMPGISEHLEIKLLHEKGLTKRQAIAAATNNFSIFFKWTDRGLIEKGRFADILVLSGNPLDDLNNLKKIEMLFLNGEKIDRDSLLKR
ncbi:MAG TPA: amidohydrolase family protein [Chitinophagaceae bacterium]